MRNEKFEHGGNPIGWTCNLLVLSWYYCTKLKGILFGAMTFFFSS